MSIKRTTVAALALAVVASMAGVLHAQEAPAGAGQVAAEGTPATETKEQHDARMAWWREARFGMFIHWGIYSVPAGTWQGRRVGGGEWIMNVAKIPVKDYAAFAPQFNPVKFNAQEWVLLAKSAGMKYIVITAKHHDGFAMFHSQASAYNIFDATPFKRDPLKELAAACEKHGMKLGFYYSQAQDWHHAGGAAIGGHWDKAQDGDMTQYIRTVAAPQVRELLSNYGKVSVLWWDTPQDMTRERADLLAPLLKLQPGIISNDRLGGGYPGDSGTPEQFIPTVAEAGRDWETCMTINDNWGYQSYDQHWKSTQTLVRNLVTVAGKGGNYLLNVGPTAEGVIPDPCPERLREVGQWLQTNGEAIYGTTAGPFRKLPWGQCTQKGSKLYLHVFDWPKDGRLLVPMSSPIAKAYLLSQPAQMIKSTMTADGVSLSIPESAPDAIASVVVLETQGPVQAIIAPVLQAADGSIDLQAADAQTDGKTLRIEGGSTPNLGYWTQGSDSAHWKVRVAKAGTFEVTATYACEPGTAGSEYAVELGGGRVTGKVQETKGWQDYRTVKLGTMAIGQTGDLTATVKVVEKPNYAVMNLRTITLKAVPQGDAAK